MRKEHTPVEQAEPVGTSEKLLGQPGGVPPSRQRSGSAKREIRVRDQGVHPMSARRQADKLATRVWKEWSQ
jgi:hypothetical protein